MPRAAFPASAAINLTVCRSWVKGITYYQYQIAGLSAMTFAPSSGVRGGVATMGWDIDPNRQRFPTSR